MKRVLMFLLPAIWLSAAQAGDRVESWQLRACEGAVMDQPQFRGLPPRGLTALPDRVNHRGLAWIDWRFDAAGVTASGYCKVESDGRVTKVSTEEFERDSDRREHSGGGKYPGYDRDRDPDWGRDRDRGGDYAPPRQRGLPGGMTMDRDVARRGDPYRDFEVSDPVECAWACLDDDRCLAYNYREREGTCGLKGRLVPAERERGVISGVKEIRFRIDNDRARVGKPYRAFRTPDVAQCKAACMAEGRCVAFNYRIDEQSCGLKDEVEKTRYERGVVSGEKEYGGR